eukprot:jgi/Mesvir1/2555/Mv09611-RA.1
MASPMHAEGNTDDEDILAELLGRDDDAYDMSDDDDTSKPAVGEEDVAAWATSAGDTAVPAGFTARENVDGADDHGSGVFSGLQAPAHPGDGRRSLANYSDVVELSDSAPTQPVTQISARGHRPPRDLDACSGAELPCTVPLGFMGSDTIFQSRDHPGDNHLEEGEVPCTFVMGTYTKEPHGRHHSAKAGARHKLAAAQRRRDRPNGSHGSLASHDQVHAGSLSNYDGGTTNGGGGHEQGFTYAGFNDQGNRPKKPGQKNKIPGGRVHQNERKAAAEMARYVRQMCEMLQEKKWWMFRLTVDKLGREVVEGFLDRVREIEKSGGEMTADGVRRRTPGGVFWRVVKDGAPEVYRQVMESDKEQQKLNRKRQVEMHKEESLANKRQRMDVS